MLNTLLILTIMALNKPTKVFDVVENLLDPFLNRSNICSDLRAFLCDAVL